MMRAGAIVAGAVALVAVFAWLGAVTASSTAHPDPLPLEHGVPVVVADTPQGAVAAAQNYLGAEDQALLEPTRLRQVVDTEWTPQEREGPDPRSGVGPRRGAPRPCRDHRACAGGGRIQAVVATLDREELRWGRSGGGRIGLDSR